jgi:cytochrome d ubiquinol oxidase subunit I
MVMDPVLLARIQFALTIGFHYIFPPITIGLAWINAWLLWRYLRSGDESLRKMAGFWIEVFTLCFAVGVATGITMEFQFGMNWADYSRFVGDIFGAPLAAEGIFAFFLESSFLGVLLFGENRVSKKVYTVSAFMVAIGATISAFWIIVANSWQQTPAGYQIVGGRAQLTDFWAAIFNASTLPRFLHTLDGALITGAFFMFGLSSWFLLRVQHLEFAKRSFSVAMVVGFIASVLQLPLGHYHAVQVAETQPVKLAAFEGLWETQTHAPLLAFGIPNLKEQRTDWAVAFPGLLSLATSGSAETEVAGLKQFPPEQRPPLYLTFFSFHLMVGLGMYFIFLTALGLLLLKLGLLYQDKFKAFLWLCLLSIPLPIIANELGWIAAEVGRQPWIVYGLMRTDQAVSKVVSAAQILFSIGLFSAIYALLFGVWIFLLGQKLRKGPRPETETPAGAQEVPK